LTLTLSAPAEATGGLAAGYRPIDGRFDELIGADGLPRAGWRPFLERFEAIGPEGREAVGRTTEQKLLESGIAFNVHADPDDRQAAWRLDLLPVILDAAAWHELESGLIQRARLIEAVLQDLYGAQRLLRSGVLPPSLVFGNPEFLHACSGWPEPPKRFLHLYACDVARDPDGGWRVLADQIDAPAGNGWLLASRVALSQGLGELYLESGVRRVASYYARLQAGLQAAAPGEDGRIVVLSTGADDPGFFSHAYLARYLGYALVEPADLTERDGQLYLKTLEGLQRVDLVLRKIAGRYADPLNLPNPTGGGTPGLVQAARLGRTVIANGLGAGVLQNRALAGHASALAETLLGEPALLREATALWLGEPAAQARVLAEPGWAVSRLTARHDPGATGDRVDPLPGLADDDARRQFLAREGHLWIAERPSPLPTTPGFDGRGLQPVHWAMRAFVAIDDEGCHVLPGGLVRQTPAAAVVGLPNGHGSKDLWVLREPGDAAAPSILTRRLAAVHLRRTGRDLLSRTAEQLFWLGRYTERAEVVLRVLRAVLSRLIEDGGPDRQPALMEALLAVYLPGLPSLADTHRGRIGRALERLLHDGEPPYGMRRSIDGSRRNATLARGVLSQDGWRILNALFNDRRWRKSTRPVLTAPPIDLVNDAIHQLVAFAGTAAENMTRNYSWRFLDIGTRLERALEMLELVAVLAGRRHEGVDETIALTALLEIGDSYMTYRSRYAVTPMAVPVIDLLLLDESNPRSLAFQLVALEAHLAALPHDSPYRSPAARKVLGVLTELRLADPDRLAEDDEGARLQAFFARARADLGLVSDLMGRAYFVLAETPTSTFATRRGERPDAADL
jgi:uncharacterized circularly permuted ATP-grasp superfamily protein/uncharacterized alpha-E superfamily protein